MYYRLKAKSWKKYNHALFAAESNGFDPDVIDTDDYTFDVGTGAIEKVRHLISKYNLDILIEDEFAPGPLSYAYVRR